MPKHKLDYKDFKKIPNIISVFRFLASIFILCSIFIDIKAVVVQVLYVVAALSDKADGMIARKYKMETKLGLYLEGFADGLLIFATIIYLTFKTDFQRNLLVLSILIFIFGLIVSFIIYLITKKWFSVTLPVNRVAVFAAHILIVFYIFSLPYRQEVAVGIFYFGLILALVYFAKMIKFGCRQIKS